MGDSLIFVLFALAACILLMLLIGGSALWLAWRYFPDREGIVEKETDTTSLIPSPVMPAAAHDPSPAPEEKDAAPPPPEPPPEEAERAAEASTQKEPTDAEQGRIEVIQALTEKTRQGRIDWQPRTDGARGLYDASIPGAAGPLTSTAFIQTSTITGRIALSLASNAPDTPHNFVVIQEEDDNPPQLNRALRELYAYASKEKIFFGQIAS